MRLITILLSLFLCSTVSQLFCKDLDTTKRVVKIITHRNVHSYKPRGLLSIHDLPNYMLHYEDCVFTHQYTISQRLKKYPFNKAAKILAVSFPGPERNADILINNDTTSTRLLLAKRDSIASGFHFTKDSLGYEYLIEVKQLNPADINRLTYLMFNTKIKRRLPDQYANPGMKCFFPRNALIFFDKNGKEFDRLWVCFECLGQESTSNRLFIGSGCNQNYDLMKKFFISVGIRFGTTIKEYSKVRKVTYLFSPFNLFR